MPTPGVPPNMRLDWFKPKLELLETEYKIAGRNRTVLSMLIVNYGSGVKLTIYRTGYVVVEKPAEEVSEEEKKQAYHVAVVAENVLKRIRGV